MSTLINNSDKKSVLDGVKLELSTNLAKNVKKYGKTFNGVRSFILATVSEKVISDNLIIKTLKSTKGKTIKGVKEYDGNLYRLINNLSAYTLRGVKDGKEFNIMCEYDYKGVLNACEVYCLCDMNPAFIKSVQVENLEAAKLKVFKAIGKAEKRLKAAKLDLHELKSNADEDVKKRFESAVTSAETALVTANAVNEIVKTYTIDSIK